MACVGKRSTLTAHYETVHCGSV